MKRIIFSGLLMAVLAGSALAQQPMYQQLPAGGPTLPAVPATATYDLHHGGCSSGCCTPTQTICVPEQTCKEKKTPIYSKTCAPFCVPACHCCLHSLFGGGDSGCGGCDSGCGSCGAGCEQPRTKYYLVKKYCVEQVPTTVCHPVTVPACGAAPGCCSSGPIVSHTTPATTAVPMETVPYRAMPK
jgi:hypothetical protein